MNAIEQGGGHLSKMGRDDQRPPKESILDLERYSNVRIFVELSGQRRGKISDPQFQNMGILRSRGNT